MNIKCPTFAKLVDFVRHFGRCFKFTILITVTDFNNYSQNIKKKLFIIVKSKLILILSIFSTIIFLGCSLNQYETNSVGFYKVVKYELADSTKKIPFDFPTLTVNADKTFSLDLNNKTIKGKWKADNYGDWTVADFFYNEHDVQGEILNDNEIDIINPYLFNCPFLKTMIFKKVQKDTDKK